MKNLPSPPPYKIGWLWTESSQDLSKLNLIKSNLPKIRVVIPNYNQDHYLEETIRSVLLQDYPNLESIIIDGGSTDNSIEIIKKYEQFSTYWIGERDRAVPDLVRHNITGYLATPEDFSDFCQGIIQLLEDNQLRIKMKQNCREIAINEYSLELQAQRYVEIYQRLLETQQNNINTTEIAEKLTTTST